MKQVTTSVGFQDPLGNLVASGDLILDLSQGAEVLSGGGLIAPKRVVLPLTALGRITPTNMYFNDELTPSGTTYHATLMDSGLNQIADFGQWSIVGASSDLSTMIPTTTGVSVAGVVLLNPVAQQTINGQPLDLEGTGLGFSAAASTTIDSAISRISSGVLAAGISIGDGSGQFNAATFQATTAFKTSAANPAASGLLRGANNTTLVASRNAASNADLALLGTDASNNAVIGPQIRQTEQGAPLGVNSSDLIWADNVAHRWKMNNNNGGQDVVVGAATTDTLSSKTLAGTVPFNRFRANQGSALISGDFSIGAGFGNTASISGIGGTDAAGAFTITANGTGLAANPSVTLTFHDGTWTVAPVVVASRGDVNTAGHLAAVSSPTAVQFTLNSTPSAGQAFLFNFICVGK